MLQRAFMVFVAACGILAAQDPPSRAGRISYVSGAVSFQPAGVTDWVAATINRPLTIGDQLYADSGAHAEVHLPGMAFRLGDRTAFEFMNLDDQSVQVRLSEGTLDLRVRNLTGNIEVDAPNMAFTVSQPGDYRIDTNPDNGQTLVTDRTGGGQIVAGGGSFSIQPGQQAVITGQDQSAQCQINGAPGADSFDQWVESRDHREDRYAQSQYVSTQMVGYEDLGEYGTWRSAPEYGSVWVPNGVAAGWTPYTDGHWAWVDPWGWTWVDDEPWGFAPFHYGRWAYVSGYWGWCPGPVAQTPVYAPALVAWVGFGAGVGVSIGVGGGPAVGWFPLGPRDVYIPGFTASSRYVDRINVTNTRVINTTYVNNAYNGYLRTKTIPVASYANRSVPGAVVAVPQNAFAGARPVRQAVVRLQPNQISGIRAVAPAPRVPPQVASVLGHPAAGNVPRPPANVLSRPVVARRAPPAAPPAFQQRQALLARNPGRPLAAAQLHQLASSNRAVAARPPVRVMSQVHPITPQRAHAAAPAPGRSNVPPATQTRTAPPDTRPGMPAAAQPRNAVAPAPQRTAPTAPNRAAAPPARANNPYAPKAQPGQRTAPAQAQQRPIAPPARQPAQQAQHAAPVQAQHRPAAPPARQPAVQAQHAAPVQAQHRPAAPPARQPAVQAQHRSSPEPQAERQMQPAARPPAHQAAPASRPQVQHQAAPARPQPAPRRQAAPAPRPQAQHPAAPPRQPPQRQAPAERRPTDHR